MNIIEMAERSGFGPRTLLAIEPYLERFAALVRAAALEEAMAVALAEPRVWDQDAPDPQHRIAAAIRQLKESK